MGFSPTIAARYLRPKRTFVSIITAISVLGVALGVWLPMVVIAIYNGYGERIKESVLGFEPHLVVDAGADVLGKVEDFAPLLETIEGTAGVAAVTPIVRGQVVMDFAGMRSVLAIRGILPPKGKELERMNARIARAPDFETPGDPERTALKDGFFGDHDSDSAVISDIIAEGQGIGIGDTLQIYSPRDIDTLLRTLDQVEQAETEEARRAGREAIRQMNAPEEVTVTGILDSGDLAFGADIIFLQLETAQALYKLGPEECHGIAIRLEDAFIANHLSDSLAARIPGHYRILTWMETHKLLFDTVAGERQVMYLILSVILVVAGFCIMSTMITVACQKRSEIGLMKALGAREEQVAAVFLFKGAFVGLIGVAAGIALAQLTIHFRNDLAGLLGRNLGMSFFSEGYLSDDGLPAVQTMRDLAIISGGAFLACTVASILPAWFAASVQPAEALRGK